MNLQRFQFQVSQWYTLGEVLSCIVATTEDVTISDVTTTSATVSWTIPSFITPEQYYVAYGTDPDNLNQTSATINSPTDTSLTNLPYSTTLSGLEPGSLHYIQVTAVFDDEFVRYTEILFLTKEPGNAYPIISIRVP